MNNYLYGGGSFGTMRQALVALARDWATAHGQREIEPSDTAEGLADEYIAEGNPLSLPMGGALDEHGEREREEFSREALVEAFREILAR